MPQKLGSRWDHKPALLNSGSPLGHEVTGSPTNKDHLPHAPLSVPLLSQDMQWKTLQRTDPLHCARYKAGGIHSVNYYFNMKPPTWQDQGTVGASTDF